LAIKTCKRYSLPHTQERQHNYDQENKVMISKMLHLRVVNSPYSLEAHETARKGQYKPTNIGQKILDMKKLIENNEVLLDINCRA
jgi:hypothetical protein